MNKSYSINNMDLELVIKTSDILEKLGDKVNNNLHKFINSPYIERYRNNILYSIGYNLEKKIEIGPLQKDKSVLESSSNLTSCKLANDICLIVKNWILLFSRLPVIDYKKYKGFWRHINIRNNLKNHYIIIFRFNDFENYKELWNYEKIFFIEYLKVKSISLNYNLKNISFQICEGKKEPTVYDPIYYIYNEDKLYENIVGYKFCIEPLIFFQVNTFTAEIIFSKIIELVNKGANNSVLLDLCCGSGIYSILLSKYFMETIGIDNSKVNIEIANYNSTKNNIFICNRVENIIKDTFINYKNQNKIVVINPPRRGLYKEVLESINNNIDEISQIIYISCYAPTLKRDLDMLNLGNKKIKDIIPINQFPKTEHYEIIVNIY